jgi:predicted lipoprotein
MAVASSAARPAPRLAIAVVAALAAVAFFWAFPLFRIVPLQGAAANPANASSGGAFDPAATAVKVWSGELREAMTRATAANVVAEAIRADAAAARRKHARSVGMGTAYYFIQGSGKVIARDRSSIRIALDGEIQPAVVALRTGPIFGNAVRDGIGLLDVNQVPGLHEFNALAAELNKLVESEVLPGLREKADVGATITFAGCAEAPESAAAGDEPLLTVVPVMAEVRR